MWPGGGCPLRLRRPCVPVCGSPGNFHGGRTCARRPHPEGHASIVTALSPHTDALFIAVAAFTGVGHLRTHTPIPTRVCSRAHTRAHTHTFQAPIRGLASELTGSSCRGTRACALAPSEPPSYVSVRLPLAGSESHAGAVELCVSRVGGSRQPWQLQSPHSEGGRTASARRRSAGL